MSKLKKTDEIFILKRKIREQEETIRKLYRKLNNELKQEKHEAKKSTKIKEPEAEQIPDEKDGSKCPQCPKGKLIVSDLGFRVMTSCSDCKYKKVTKNG